MHQTIKNILYSKYEGIDYRVNNGKEEPIEQGYFRCSKIDNKSRLISLVDIISQIVMFIFEVLSCSLFAPLLLGISAMSAAFALPTLFISLKDAKDMAKMGLFLAYVAGLCALQIPVSGAARTFAIGANILGTICPKIGQMGRREHGRISGLPHNQWMAVIQDIKHLVNNFHSPPATTPT